ncbi:hypothetical protein EXW96_06890 [Paenibacillus sp. JMULE4]|uniref:hypothetical protein n=1 Tax=Paenibacillus TaxID=44249 RepID=UPI00088D1483|nr:MULTISPECIES: hypothetical protein [Paenibacillus]NTZ17298.1 hypothetical protein [Paenibacillus sp. JMULE4]SDJ91371.1 hypothetical protein SAMN05421868_15616 [Paenibacillus naphthalenovorans]
MFKKALSLILAISLVIPVGISTAATEKEPKEKDPEKILLKAGFPQSLLDTWPDNVKQDWVDRGVTKYEGQVSQYYKRDTETGKLNLEQTVDSSTGPGDVSLMGTIPSSDMVFRITRASSGTRTWGIQNEIEWLNPDFIMGPEDTLATSWSSNLRAYGNTFSCYQMYKDSAGIFRNDPPGNCGGQPFNAEEKGVAWKIDFTNGFDGYKAYSLQTVYVSNGSTSGTASIYSRYAHDTSSNYQIQVNFANYGSIAFSSSGSFDQAANQNDWTY